MFDSCERDSGRCVVFVEGAELRKELEYLLNLVSTDPSPQIRRHILQALIRHSQTISSPSSELDTADLVHRLWNLMVYVLNPITTSYQ